ncbi:MAG: flagellar basal body L-ring protein FlgH [Ignavibacteriae bacterium]|nr:flagellar basal body L-ring protein FlgH [Ignavibacteriota bacterium]
MNKKYQNKLKKTLLVIGVIFIAFPVLLNGQSMKENGFRSLFSDYKAVNLGDAITIIVVESSQASNQAEKSSGRDSQIDLGLTGNLGSTQLPPAGLNLGTRNDFKGGGSSKSSGMVKTKLSALIDSVLSNGLLRIKGSRKIVVNEEEQMITIKGFVRTSDIRSDNTIYSYNISEAEIVFQSDGQINSVTSPGWVTKLFHWLF